MSVECTWCTRVFAPRDANSPNHYRLENAGLTICWDCSDSFDLAEVELHIDQLRGSYQNQSVWTDNRQRLPFTVTDPRRGRWSSSYRMDATDSYGKSWKARLTKDMIVLTPTG